MPELWYLLFATLELEGASIYRLCYSGVIMLAERAHTAGFCYLTISGAARSPQAIDLDPLKLLLKQPHLPPGYEFALYVLCACHP